MPSSNLNQVSQKMVLLEQIKGENKKLHFDVSTLYSLAVNKVQTTGYKRQNENIVIKPNKILFTILLKIIVKEIISRN